MNKGQSIYEVVVVIGVISLILIALIFLATLTIRNNSYSTNKVLSSRYSQEGSEWIRGQRDKNWNDFKTKVTANQTYCLDSLNWNNTGVCGATEYISGTRFQRQAIFACFSGSVSKICSDLTVDTIESEVSVSWSDAQGTHEVKNKTYLTKWK